jgi:hypothetical protein
VIGLQGAALFSGSYYAHPSVLTGYLQGNDKEVRVLDVLVHRYSPFTTPYRLTLRGIYRYLTGLLKREA